MLVSIIAFDILSPVHFLAVPNSDLL